MLTTADFKLLINFSAKLLRARMFSLPRPSLRSPDFPKPLQDYLETHLTTPLTTLKSNLTKVATLKFMACGRGHGSRPLSQDSLALAPEKAKWRLKRRRIGTQQKYFAPLRPTGIPKRVFDTALYQLRERTTANVRHYFFADSNRV